LKLNDELVREKHALKVPYSLKTISVLNKIPSLLSWGYNIS